MNAPDTPKPKRRWFQFSLRSLLVLTLLCAIACSWLAVKKQRADRQRELIRAIRKAGGTAWYDYQVNADVVRVGATNPPAPTWLIETLGVDFFADVLLVDLGSRSSDHIPIERLAGLTDLKGLHLPCIPVTDAGLKHVTGLTNLWVLDITDTQVTDAGLKHLTGLANLKELHVPRTQVTDAGLKYLTGLTNLRQLDITDTQVTDEGVEKLQQALPELQIHH